MSFLPLQSCRPNPSTLSEALSVHVGGSRLPADAKGDAILLVDVPVVDAVFLFVFVGHESRGGRRLGPRERRRESKPPKRSRREGWRRLGASRHLIQWPCREKTVTTTGVYAAYDVSA